MSDEYISEAAFWDDWGVIQKADGGLFDFDDIKDQPLVDHRRYRCLRR